MNSGEEGKTPTTEEALPLQKAGTRGVLEVLIFCALPKKHVPEGGVQDQNFVVPAAEAVKKSKPDVCLRFVAPARLSKNSRQDRFCGLYRRPLAGILVELGPSRRALQIANELLADLFTASLAGAATD